MMKNLKRIKRNLSRFMRMKRDVDSGYARLSYAQEGEDVIIGTLLENIRRGFFVDVGAHHPKRFSNTYLLYLRGWSGVNLDPTPGSMTLFRNIRPRDTNLELGVGREREDRRFFVFQEGALNTFDPELAKERQDAGRLLVAQHAIGTLPLRNILDAYCRQPLDFLNVDAEGCDLEVLQSNDWDRYRPRLVCVEALKGDDDRANGWLMGLGYKLVALTGRSRIYEWV